MKRTIGAILFVLYAIIAITVTVLLLSFNEYNCSKIGGYTVYIVGDDALEPEYKQGSVLLIKETSDKHVKENDKIFLYKVINSQEFEVVEKTLVEKTQQGRHIIYKVEDEAAYDTSYFIGKSSDTIVLGAPFGFILSILESKWGYLFCIVIVSLLLFLQEVFDLIIELKYGGTKGTKAANVSNARKNAKKTATSKKTTAKKATASKTATKTTVASSATVSKNVETEVKANDTQEGVEKEG